jgi:dTDP-glucose pyrophosphorylase
MQDLKHFFIEPDSTLRRAMQIINDTAKGIALIVDNERRLQGVVTDGDIRRALLKGATLDAAVNDWMMRQPITCTTVAGSQEISTVMNLHSVRQLPILDEVGRVVDLRLAGEPSLAPTLPVKAVIMAGGFGERLRPLTDSVPKPLLRVGNRPILEIILGLLREWGVREVCLAVNYKADMIESYFQDGSQWDMSIRYLHEPKRLGTIGALSLITDEIDRPVLVMNGDILTRLDFRKMYRAHCDSSALMTVGVRRYDLQVPFGVLNIDGTRVTSLAEKPVLEFFVNAGIYLLEPAAVRCIPRDTQFDATDLIATLLNDHQPIHSYSIHEYWLDIGQLPDYERANQDVHGLAWGEGNA